MNININWNAFLLVFTSALGFTLLIVSCFSVGVRLLTNVQNVQTQARKGKRKAQQSESLNLIGAYLAFAICLVALAYGIYLVVPFLHA